jgi:hypothetical protein
MFLRDIRGDEDNYSSWTSNRHNRLGFFGLDGIFLGLGYGTLGVNGWLGLNLGEDEKFRISL